MVRSPARPGAGTGAAALPWSPAVLLATHVAVVSDPNAEVEYYLHAGYPASLEDPPYSGNDVPCYADGADASILRQLYIAGPCESLPIATINVRFDPATVGEVAS